MKRTLLQSVLNTCGRGVCFHARHYHASLSPEEREAVQAEWTNGDVPIIVATIAFGMGARHNSSLPERAACHDLQLQRATSPPLATALMQRHCFTDCRHQQG